MTPRRILVMQLARLGDLVQTWPLLNRLGILWPEARLDLLCETGLASLVSWGPPVHHARGLDLVGFTALAQESPSRACRKAAAEVGALCQTGYDLVFNLNFSRLSLLLAHLVGAPVRGYQPVKGGREFGRDPWLSYIFALAHTRRLNRVHLSDAFRHLAPPAPATAPRVAPAKTGEGRLIALQLGTRHPKRTWPRGAFAALARLLIQRCEAELLLVGTGAERPAGDWLVSSLPPSLRERVDNRMGQTTLPELAREVRRASLLIGGDTGTLHLAASLGVRTLGLFFGPARCHETGPYGIGHAVLQAEPPCHPCREAEPCEEPCCAQMITPEAAARVAAALLQEKLGDVAPPPAGVRLYVSGLDWLGATYTVLQGSPPALADLAGEAYRQAAARLLGLKPPPAPPPSELLPGLKEALGTLVEKVGRHGTTTSSWAAPEPLGPLLAFRAEVERQAGWQGGAERWRGLWQAVHQDFLHQLAEWAG